jgi:hypothetical protein
MTQTLIGVLALLGLCAFIVFAFGQGMRVKPSGRPSGVEFTPSDFNPPH